MQLQLIVESALPRFDFIPTPQHARIQSRCIRAEVSSGRQAEPEQRMCADCGAGPMVNFECPNLQAHNEAGMWRRGKNACPACGSFRSNWKDLPLWDGGELRQQKQRRLLFGRFGI
mmetsp:Transcript_78757/g.144888  ORF Transcript_78757/g.144888 Transcript_78757/m.144888 type:complete len:116 (-) Transcript_78757:116-463(-)